MSKDDVRRYIKFEAPSLAMVENDVSKVVCFRNGCSEQVTVDPSTLVPEDDEAVDLVAQVNLSDEINGLVILGNQC